MLHIPDIVLICRSKYLYGINKLKLIKNIDICFSLFSIYLKWTLNMKINEIYLDLYVVDNNLEIAILSIFCLNWWRGYLLLRGSHKDRQIFHSLCVFEICIFCRSLWTLPKQFVGIYAEQELSRLSKIRHRLN